MIKQILLALILLSSVLFAQEEKEGYYYPNGSSIGDGEGYIINPNLINFVPQIVSTPIDLTTGPPYTRYTDLYVSLAIPQYMGFLGEKEWVLNDSMPDWSIQWDMKMLSGTYVFGRNIPASGSFACGYSAPNLYFSIKDTVYPVYALNGNTDWHSYGIFWDSSASTLTMVVDGSTTYVYHTTIPNISGTGYKFAWGSHYQLEGSGISNIVGNGGAFNGGFDNIKLTYGNTSTNNINFNNGTIMSDSIQCKEWANQGPHDYRFSNMYPAYDPMAIVNYYNPTILNKPGGTIKDTLKYFTFPEYDSTGGGLIKHTTNGGARATINDADERNGLILVGGIFSNISSDTNNSIGNNIAIFNTHTNNWQSINTTGLAASAFVFKVKWLNDSAGACSILNNGRFLTIFNINNDNSWTYQYDSMMLPFEVMRDTIWNVNGRRLQGRDIYTHNLTTVLVFNEAWGDMSSNNAIGRVGDTLVVSVGMHLYYVYNHVIVETHTLMPYTAIDKLTIGGVWYKGITASIDRKRVYVGGDFKGFDGILSQNVGYFENGTFHSMGNVGGLSGNCIDYNLSCLEGSFTNNVTDFAEPYPGEMLMVGGFRTADGTPIGSNVVQWNKQLGFRPLDNGPSWTCWTIFTYEKNGFVRLGFTGDGLDANGYHVNHVWGRYLDAELRTLKPCLVVNEPGDLTPGSFPATVTTNVFSKQQRQVITKLTYHKNYNGVNDTVIMSQYDSTLKMSDGGWRHYLTGNIAGTYVAGDTIYCNVRTVDDYGNDSTHAWIEQIVAPPMPSTPNYVWDYNDLANGVVTTWLNQKDTLTLRQSTTSNKPVKSSAGVTFDSISTLFCLMPHLPGSAITVAIKMKILDTNTATQQRIFSYNRTATPRKELTLQIQTHAVSVKNKLGSRYLSSTTTGLNTTYPTNLGNHYQQNSVFILSADTSINQSLYVNNVTTGTAGAAFTSGSNIEGFGLGNCEGTGGMKNVIIQYVVIYFRTLSAEEKTQLYTSLMAMQ